MNNSRVPAVIALAVAASAVAAQAPIYEIVFAGEITTIVGSGDPGAESQFGIGTPFSATLVVSENAAGSGGGSFFDSVIASEFLFGSEAFTSFSDDGDFGRIAITRTPPGGVTFFASQNLGEVDGLNGSLNFNTPGNSVASWNSDLSRPVTISGTDYSLSRFTFFLFEEVSSGLVSSSDFSDAVEDAALFDRYKQVSFTFINPGGNETVIFRSVDALDVSVRVVPAPASVMLLASGCLAFARRRR